MRIKRAERRKGQVDSKMGHEKHDGFAKIVRRKQVLFSRRKVSYIIHPYV